MADLVPVRFFDLLPAVAVLSFWSLVSFFLVGVLSFDIPVVFALGFPFFTAHTKPSSSSARRWASGMDDSGYVLPSFLYKHKQFRKQNGAQERPSCCTTYLRLHPPSQFLVFFVASRGHVACNAEIMEQQGKQIFEKGCTPIAFITHSVQI